MSNFETVVQTAIYNKLTNDVPLMAAIDAVYDDVPQVNSGSEAAFPYVTIGEDSHVDISTDTELMDQVSITIHTWSRQSGRSQTKQIQGLIGDSLNRANLVESGYKFINIARVGSESFLDSDGFTRHGVQTFNLLIEQTPIEVTRYFRRNLGTIDYYTHAAVTVDRIVMDVDPVSGGAGLPTGAPAVTDNVLQTIDFAYSGTISELCRNGASYFSGVMANVKYYLNGSQIHGYEIASDSNDIPDTVGTNNATVVNGLAIDWGLFTEQNTGEWLGRELVVNGGFDTDSDWIKGTGWSIAGGAAIGVSIDSFDKTLVQPNVMRVGILYSISLDGTVDTGELVIANASQAPINGETGITPSVTSFETTWLSDSADVFIKRNININNATVTKVSVKEVLNVA